MRSSFTTTEILVVIAIILILSTLVYGIAPSIYYQERITTATNNVVGWLHSARSLAARDRRPAGIRLIPDADGLVRRCLYVVEGDSFTNPSSCWILMWHDLTTQQYLAVSIGMSAFADSDIRSGDYFFLGDGVPHLIIGVTPNTLYLQNSPGPGGTWTTAGWSGYGGPWSNWVIRRAPRPVVGEIELDLPYGTVIDPNANGWYGASCGTDIMFSSSGSVIDGAPTGFVALWVRENEPTNNKTFIGPKSLVTVWRNTGVIGACEVDEVLNPSVTIPQYLHPYTYATDPRQGGR